MKGLELHGKGWKKIAKLIKTRTVVQIRTHAQKYFQRMAKAKKNGQHDLLMDSRAFGKKVRGGGGDEWCIIERSLMLIVLLSWWMVSAWGKAPYACDGCGWETSYIIIVTGKHVSEGLAFSRLNPS